VLVAGALIVIVSMLLAFLSGMNVKRRVLTNLIIIAAAVGITYLIGRMVNTLWGISI
jgi:vacuolar iron transporter family protein